MSIQCKYRRVYRSNSFIYAGTSLDVLFLTPYVGKLTPQPSLVIARSVLYLPLRRSAACLAEVQGLTIEKNLTVILGTYFAVN